MKRHFLKTSLLAFAFIMAIVASFAFSPALNDAEDVVIPGYIQIESPKRDCEEVIHGCSSGGTLCTVTPLGGPPTQVFRYKVGVNCSVELFRPPM